MPRATFIGRAQGPDGPHVIAIRQGRLFDLTQVASTSAGAIARRAFTGGREIGPAGNGLPEGWALLSPIDLQCVKAAGVTFALSAIERVIEERARGDAARAASIRQDLEDKVGAGIRSVVPGIARSGGTQVGTDRGRHVVAIPGSRHRAGCGDLLQVARAVHRGPRRCHWRAQRFQLEQSRTRSGAGVRCPA
jgi:hypothetical protein